MIIILNYAFLISFPKFFLDILIRQKFTHTRGNPIVWSTLILQEHFWHCGRFLTMSTYSTLQDAPVAVKFELAKSPAVVSSVGPILAALSFS